MSELVESSVRVIALLSVIGCAPVASGPPAASGGSTGFPSETGGTGDTGGAGGLGSGGVGGVASSGGGTGTGGGSGGFGAAPTDGGGGTAPNTAPGYVNLAPPTLEPLDPNGATTLSPPAPDGWSWYPIADAQCRDGSPLGIFVRFGAVPKLLIYLEGGGACTDAGFCNYNPPNVNMAIVGTGETVLGSAAGLVASRQQPGVYTGGVLQGIFDDTNTANPYKGWSMVYVPYCTGDVHFGSKPNATVTGVQAPQQFVGYSNMQKIVGHLVPTFGSKVERVVLTGASAGSFGAALNFSMVQDAFGTVRADAILDSGLPFSDKYMFPCMQKFWRSTWNLDAALPPDCTDCFQSDGGGLVHLADFLMKKHPNATVAAISSMEDEVMRLFFSMGLNNCATIDTADPVAITIGQVTPGVYYPAADYTSGIEEMLHDYAPTKRLAAYGIAGTLITYHQHTFRSRFYDTLTQNTSLAQFTADFLAGNVQVMLPSGYTY